MRRLQLPEPGPADLVVDVEWSGISTGTERLLWSGKMPPFPGMGYPLVPGYETVGRVVEAGGEAGTAVGARVFVPGAKCFGDVRGLFGGAASRLVVPAARTVAFDAGSRRARRPLRVGRNGLSCGVRAWSEASRPNYRTWCAWPPYRPHRHGAWRSAHRPRKQPRPRRRRHGLRCSGSRQRPQARLRRDLRCVAAMPASSTRS